MELATLREEMENVKDDILAGFCVSQPYYDKCGGYYINEFDDCLKQMAAVYPKLDLSRVIIDDTVPPIPGGPNAISDEVDDSVHTVKEKVKELEAEAIDQPTPKGQIIPNSLATLEGLSALDGMSTKDQSTSEAPLLNSLL